MSRTISSIVGLGMLLLSLDAAHANARVTSRVSSQSPPGREVPQQQRGLSSPRLRAHRQMRPAHTILHEDGAHRLSRWIAKTAESDHPQKGLVQLVHWGVSDHQGIKIRDDGGDMYLEVPMFRPNAEFSITRATELLKRTLRSDPAFSAYSNLRIRVVPSAN